MTVLNRTLSRAKQKELPRLRLVPLLLIAGGAIAFVGLLQVMQTSNATTASFATQRLEQQRLELQVSVQGLEAEVAGLSSLSRLQQEADRLGLVPPQEQQSLQVNVPGPQSQDESLPSRFAPAGTAKARGGSSGSSWWQGLLKLLPFR